MKVRLVYLLSAVTIAIGTVGLLLFTMSVKAASSAASSVIWTDDFISTTLDGRWSWVREDPTHWSLTAAPGFLRLTTQQTFSAVNNLLVQNMPVGDYEVQSRLLFTPTQNYQFAGLLVYQDDNNWLTLGRAFCGVAPPTCVNNGIYFDRKEGGLFVGSNHAMTSTAQGEAYLKVLRRGTIYTGYVSTDNSSWTLVGVHTVIITPTKVGLKASNQIQGDAELSADFDFFTLIDNSKRLFLPLILK